MCFPQPGIFWREYRLAQFSRADFSRDYAGTFLETVGTNHRIKTPLDSSLCPLLNVIAQKRITDWDFGSPRLSSAPIRTRHGIRYRRAWVWSNRLFRNHYVFSAWKYILICHLQNSFKIRSKKFNRNIVLKKHLLVERNNPKIVESVALHKNLYLTLKDFRNRGLKGSLSG